MKHKRAGIFRSHKRELNPEFEKSIPEDTEALNELMDYFTMNGVEILRGNPIYVNGLKRLIPEKDLSIQLKSKQ